MNYCFLNGKIIPFDQAWIRPDDLGVVRGFGVFDFLRTYNGKPATLERNLKRLRNSAQILGLVVPFSDEEITDAIATLLQKNAYAESSIRIVLTGGVSPDLFTPQKTSTFYILVAAVQNLAKEVYEKGTKLITCEHLRVFPEAKTLNYLLAVQKINERTEAGAIEILFTYQGKVLECSTSNFYIFKGDSLVTAKKNILGGVTRQIVLGLAQKEFQVEERDVLISELDQANEAFLTASNKKIVPVVMIDGRQIGNGKVGENTKKLMQAFESYMNQ